MIWPFIYFCCGLSLSPVFSTGVPFTFRKGAASYWALITRPGKRLQKVFLFIAETFWFDCGCRQIFWLFAGCLKPKKVVAHRRDRGMPQVFFKKSRFWANSLAKFDKVSFLGIVLRITNSLKKKVIFFLFATYSTNV